MTDERRAALVRRWLELTREVLPGMAVREEWPIRLDHCFMRVFLDHAVGGRWDLEVRRPAIRFMRAEALARAVTLAEEVVITPRRLAGLNAQSLMWRVQRRERGAGGTRGGV